MDAAGGRCTCTGACGSKHTKDGGRCAHGTGWNHHLYAAPADPFVPARTAWRVDPADLTAWCGRCLDGAQRAARRTTSAPATEPALFELPTTTSTVKRARRAA